MILSKSGGASNVAYRYLNSVSDGEVLLIIYQNSTAEIKLKV
jgi:hypothetical protein